MDALLKPAPGVTVLDPDTRTPLDAKGERKPLNQYWRRRLRDADVVRVAEPTSKPTTPSTPRKDA